MSEVSQESGSKPRLFASSHAYAARKAVGLENWQAWITAQLAALDASHLPGFRALGQAAQLETACLSVNATGSIGRSRSCMAGAFLASSADTWLTVDDDNYAPADVLARAVLAARATRGIVALPYWLRQNTPRLSFNAATEPRPIVVEGCELLSAPGLLTGFGLVALHRSAVERVALEQPTFRDEGGARFPALFLEMVRDDLWIGEDFAFCHRAHDAGVALYLLPDAWCEHDLVACTVGMHEGRLSARRVPLDATSDAASRRAAPDASAT